MALQGCICSKINQECTYFFWKMKTPATTKSLWISRDFWPKQHVQAPAYGFEPLLYTRKHTQTYISWVCRNEPDTLLFQRGHITSQHDRLTPPEMCLSGVNEMQQDEVKPAKVSGVIQFHTEGSQSRFSNPMSYCLCSIFIHKAQEATVMFFYHRQQKQLTI